MVEWESIETIPNIKEKPIVIYEDGLYAIANYYPERRCYEDYYEGHLYHPSHWMELCAPCDKCKKMNQKEN